ncbi:hypothetical protein [Actinomadura opuntiae]|uniref:hypothetical protein n=1 Tax=Actinomadura sp. OS1-43 TaxID=604315 RepID=UPI00255AA8A0|nr:hypothetical protein [Actinomadura sp. OS1-43]MDL4813476.1 hypothetical protein [Actinomadura sp. OS1-43]
MRTVSDSMISSRVVTVDGIPAVASAQPVRPASWFPPNVMHWRGEATGSWWAMTPRGGHLIEAPTEEALAYEVHRIMAGATV